MRSAVEEEIRALIRAQGRITFARFMQACLYSPRGGFYSAREHRISTHFGTAAMSHPVFGALIARQLEQMWHLLGEPSLFHLLEAGSGDGALARSIVASCRRTSPAFARALVYIAADYAPRWLHSSEHMVDTDDDAESPASSDQQHATSAIRRVQTEGVRPFRSIVGCILSNELIDNFPVHRFAIEGGRVQEIYVTLAGDRFTEILDAPSSPAIEARLECLGWRLPEGYRGEVCLALDDWTREVARVLDRGFVLTIDYGELAAERYSPANSAGGLICYRGHAVGNDFYRDIGAQDITCLVDFTALMQSGERHGLATAGCTLQSTFLTNLGLPSFVAALETRGLSQARTTLNRMAMMALADPEQYGDFKVLAQAKGVELSSGLEGFASRAE
jgi:SAM-dependent MidA family methyltransferase